MKIENMSIAGIPAIVLGEESENVYLFIHGKMGKKEEAMEFAKLACPMGYQVAAIDLPEHGSRADSKEKLVPWVAAAEIESVYLYISERWKNISLRANSIGAWLSMQALQDREIQRALFVSPIVDMENLIENMMTWVGVTEEELRKRREIPTNFGETLSWEYLIWVREHPISWNVPTEVLYAGNDNLTPHEVIDAFTAKINGEITVMKDGEHWFHTPEQLQFMREWEEMCLKK